MFIKDIVKLKKQSCCLEKVNDEYKNWKCTELQTDLISVSDLQQVLANHRGLELQVKIILTIFGHAQKITLNSELSH